MKDLKCNSCGGKLHKIETEDNTYICLHCGSKQVLEENVTNNSYNVTNNVVNHIYGEVNVNEEKSTKSDVDELIEKAEALIKIKEYDKAYKLLIILSNEYPGMYQIWWLLTKICLLACKRASAGVKYKFDYTRYNFYYQKAMALLEGEAAENIKAEYEAMSSEIHLLANKQFKRDMKVIIFGLSILAIVIVGLVLLIR